MNNPRQKVEIQYKELIEDLQEIQKDISGIYAKNNGLRAFQKELVSCLSEKIAKTRNEIVVSQNVITWDRLVVAFFGETNAGKSTVIETFRILFEKNRKPNSDGLIVGDGQHDFTKDYHEYNLSINNHPFTLIDVPGIEGDESEFRDIIKDALNKAHCVFYVQGHNKKPDSATAKKIKDYLGDWVNVYSIQNVRGDVSYYDEEEERKTLLTDNVRKNEKLIHDAFQQILGDVYKGNITIQALLAMCAKAKFSNKRQDLIKSQTKLYRYFGSGDELLKFGQFQTITNLVNEKTVSFTDEIVEANKQKLVSLAKKTTKDLNSVLDANEEKLNGLSEKLKEFKRNVGNTIHRTTLNIKTKTALAVEFSFDELKENIYGIIDGNSQYSDSPDAGAEYYVEQMQNKLSLEISSTIQKELKEMKQKIDRYKKDLENISYLNYSDYEFDASSSVDVHDIKNALDELDINLDDVGTFTLNVAGTLAAGAGLGSVIPGLGTVVGACIGAAIGFFGNLIFGNIGESKKAEAKKEVAKSLKEAQEEVGDSVSESVAELNYKLRETQKSLEDYVSRELEIIDEFKETVEELHLKMGIFVNKIKSKNYGTI